MGATGPRGEPGEKGAKAKGERGPSGCPRAYGTVDADGALQTALSAGVTQVTKVATGVYCVQIDPARWTRGTGWPTLSSDYAANSERVDSPGGTDDHLVTLRYSSSTACGGNAFRVVASRLDLDADGDAGNGFQSRAVTSDEPFSFVLP